MNEDLREPFQEITWMNNEFKTLDDSTRNINTLKTATGLSKENNYFGLWFKQKLRGAKWEI